MRSGHKGSENWKKLCVLWNSEPILYLTLLKVEVRKAELVLAHRQDRAARLDKEFEAAEKSLTEAVHEWPISARLRELEAETHNLSAELAEIRKDHGDINSLGSQMEDLEMALTEVLASTELKKKKISEVEREKAKTEVTQQNITSHIRTLRNKRAAQEKLSAKQESSKWTVWLRGTPIQLKINIANPTILLDI